MFRVEQDSDTAIGLGYGSTSLKLVTREASGEPSTHQRALFELKHNVPSWLRTCIISWQDAQIVRIPRSGKKDDRNIARAIANIVY